MRGLVFGELFISKLRTSRAADRGEAAQKRQNDIDPEIIIDFALLQIDGKRGDKIGTKFKIWYKIIYSTIV